MPTSSQNPYPPTRQPLGRVALEGQAQARIRKLGRVALTLFAFAMIAPLALAYSLKPNPSGRGTHEQIPGFGPCTIQVLFNVPCPACGMTTSWSLFTQGQLFAALRTSASGTILAAVFVIASIWFLLSALRGKWLGWTPTPLPVAVAALSWLGLVILEWLIRRGPEIFGSL